MCAYIIIINIPDDKINCIEIELCQLRKQNGNVSTHIF